MLPCCRDGTRTGSRRNPSPRTPNGRPSVQDTEALPTGRPPIHGLTTLKRAVRRLGSRAIDRRSRTGRALAAWRADLVRDLGGTPTTAQLAIIELAVRTKLLLDSIDAWLLTQPSLVDRRKRALLPVVRERQQLADALARYLGQLGLERRESVADLTKPLAVLNSPPQRQQGLRRLIAPRVREAARGFKCRGEVVYDIVDLWVGLDAIRGAVA